MRRTAKEMFPLVKQYQSSGLNKTSFCDRHGLNLAVFHYWYRKYEEQKDEQAMSFIELEGVSGPSAVMELNYRGVQVLFYEYPPEAYLQNLLAGDD